MFEKASNLRCWLTLLGRAGIGSLLLVCATPDFGQDLAPRAYLITPIHSNAVTLAYSFFDGSVIFDGTVPITDFKARVNVAVFSYTHSLSFFKRSANISASLPYGIGNFGATVTGLEASVHRSGLFDSSFRFSVNVMGGRAMSLREFRKWQQKTVIGLSVKVVSPTGQYDSTKLVNYGNNRWAFKPELGISHRWGHWIFDTYGAIWFFTPNQNSFSVNKAVRKTQSQKPIGAFEGHLSYDVKPRFWASLDANFWGGGRTSVNGVQNVGTLQTNSRVGSTLSLPVSQRQSLKFSYSRGAYIRYGGSYDHVSMAWQYSWVGNPK